MPGFSFAISVFCMRKQQVGNGGRNADQSYFTSVLSADVNLLTELSFISRARCLPGARSVIQTVQGGYFSVLNIGLCTAKNRGRFSYL